ncbi:MAG TPA: hypothetical protein VJJ21_03465 [Candidatus Nanoarchaeia archaeon]|nr:hypothetical protein [Candidatus Nanoarchaeia archaeon]
MTDLTNLTIVVDTSNAQRLPLEEHQRISLYAARLIAHFPIGERCVDEKRCSYVEITPYSNEQGIIRRCSITCYKDETKAAILGRADLPREDLDGLSRKVLTPGIPGREHILSQ